MVQASNVNTMGKVQGLAATVLVREVVQAAGGTVLEFEAVVQPRGDDDVLGIVFGFVDMSEYLFFGFDRQVYILESGGGGTNVS